MNLTHASFEDIKRAGYLRGESMARYQTRPEVGSTQPGPDGVGEVVVDDDDIADDYMTQCAYSSEEHNRCFSPFEFTASELNKRHDADEAWEAYQEGIDEGIEAEVKRNRAAHDARKVVEGGGV